MVKSTQRKLDHPAIFAILVGVFAVILAYALASYAELGDNLDYRGSVVTRPAPQLESDSRVTAFEQQSGSDEISAIEADLNATVLSDLDADASKVLSELQGL
ncbi:hypothetical protein HYZ80_00630 [Candidatus Parcubacteria bacterium]|nr:hypothetical protein [Candidatus Parcubacteria bacterium]